MAAREQSIAVRLDYTFVLKTQYFKRVKKQPGLIYSSPYCSKPVRLSYLCWTQMEKFGRVSCYFVFIYNENSLLWRQQKRSITFYNK